MKRLLWTIPALVVGSTAVFAGASSENNLSDKALKGPDGAGAHTTDPGTDRTGGTGTAGPDGAQKAPSSKFNDYGTGAPAGSVREGGGGDAKMKDDADTGSQNDVAPSNPAAKTPSESDMR
jgi:hypothetical protein